ncbi:sulfatase family protein [Coraliomargarita sp. W4R53]
MALPIAALAATDRPPNVIVVYSDDHGYADLGAMGIRNDIRTPNLDSLARDGILFTNGYVTAPICGPSRAGLMMGRYQQRAGMETHSDFPLVLDHPPIPEQLRSLGYTTGMTGKLHLPIKGHGEDPALWGFDEFWMKAGDYDVNPHKYLMTHNQAGSRISDGPEWHDLEGQFRVDISNQFAVDFIKRNHEQPFFLYVAQFAPHVPLEAPDKYLERFSPDMPEARRYALAMISAIDEGVGRMIKVLHEYQLEQDTIIYFIGDNGAPLEDGGPSNQLIEKMKRWDGSLNEPLIGEKGMLQEGGIRVPFLAWGPGYIKGQRILNTPVITLDIGATSVALAGGKTDILDGQDLSRLFRGAAMTELETRPLFWRFGGMDAVRVGPWKLYRPLSQEPESQQFLWNFNLPNGEQSNLIKDYPERAVELTDILNQWTDSLGKKGLIRDAQLDWNKYLRQLHEVK